MWPAKREAYTLPKSDRTEGSRPEGENAVKLGSHVVQRLLVGAALLVVMTLAPVLAETAGARSYYTSSFTPGQCTWYAFHMRPDLAGHVWGNAGNWASAARASGTPIGTTPEVGAVVVFQGGVQGAWGGGHVGYVTAVGAYGTFRVSEMNFPIPGRVTSRWAHAGRGVTFIY